MVKDILLILGIKLKLVIFLNQMRNLLLYQLKAVAIARSPFKGARKEFSNGLTP